uniref:Uncharacterized protein n=1 Tax=Oryctolagus cuniculus TaxID=9986 RepID=A0A5F9DLV5_RABIT
MSKGSCKTMLTLHPGLPYKVLIVSQSTPFKAALGFQKENLKFLKQQLAVLTLASQHWPQEHGP